MNELKELYQSADWKKEKHVPLIEIEGFVKKGEFFKVKATVGKEIAHPNKTEHHIRWIALYFQPEGSKFPYEIGKALFCAHGESVDGPDTSSIYTHHEVSLSFKTDKPGIVFAGSYCNIHGLWQNSINLELTPITHTRINN
ncbi:Neelaredoxin [candidate division WOR-1 bacterium RIFOXYD2_FULL_36_8]|uniref:Neelaredoxin n=1 Tax=candidate division WOR-1 bacterium RIFOXYB2_FULL_36_35 TaxID=1802578 RepID=A0A1F4S708_UNCSA|nr:MAG: Neelaredoxin [candidate division WOR-1 bacterium RIFOXYA2_FULL_36_21]OGC16212.1 MAG: Neelaredoxin [candidate division WOR-1 bacterium RIFOXYB2_FULL_36_35]OGC19890.1 MAG: Neelaredoxin [candidate division WOR-1 bacterium RIFOXYA12_FULL_36_13]OGC39413.1 MAG: Neelaredoxin [candidate division WOR-1 bacterium RIFOXYD2_FULL_36_8]